VNSNVKRLLQIDDLHILIKQKKRSLHAVRGVSFLVDSSERVCLVGESGCGKSLTAFSILRLLPEDQFSIKGSIKFKNGEILNLSQSQMRKIRGQEISMVFQEPMTALNPVLKVGFQIVEAILAHKDMSKGKAKEHAILMLEKVGIPNAEVVYNQYPHELSGGLRQRAMIAMALSCSPSLLIADEPTTALDVTIQAQILELLKELSISNSLGLLFISHNLGVVAQIAQKVMVMYAGKIVEISPVKELFDSPLHPYTRGLLDSVPYGPKGLKDKLSSIPGSVPPLDKIPKGCSFSDRCSRAKAICQKEPPLLSEMQNNRKVACHFPLI